MSTRVRCALNYGGMRYLTTHQVVQTVMGLYRQYTGKYYLVKKGTTPMWKYLVEMVEKIPDWPERAKLKIWREKRGRAKRRVVEVAQGRAMPTAPTPNADRITQRQIRLQGATTGRAVTAGRFYLDNEGTHWTQEALRAER